MCKERKVRSERQPATQSASQPAGEPAGPGQGDKQVKGGGMTVVTVFVMRDRRARAKERTLGKRDLRLSSARGAFVGLDGRPAINESCV